MARITGKMPVEFYPDLEANIQVDNPILVNEYSKKELIEAMLDVYNSTPRIIVDHNTKKHLRKATFGSLLVDSAMWNEGMGDNTSELERANHYSKITNASISNAMRKTNFIEYFTPYPSSSKVSSVLEAPFFYNSIITNDRYSGSALSIQYATMRYNSNEEDTLIIKKAVKECKKLYGQAFADCFNYCIDRVNYRPDNYNPFIIVLSDEDKMFEELLINLFNSMKKVINQGVDYRGSASELIRILSQRTDIEIYGLFNRVVGLNQFNGIFVEFRKQLGLPRDASNEDIVNAM